MPNQNSKQDLKQDQLQLVNNTNLLAHAKKKAKKLFNLSKEKNFVIEITSLSEAQQIIAKINGYDNWHILEQVCQQKNVNPLEFESNRSNKHWNKFKRINNFILNDSHYDNIPYVIDEKNNIMQTFIQIDSVGLQRYQDILFLLQHVQESLKFILDREFSTIELDMFHIKDQTPNLTKRLYDSVDMKIQSLLLDSTLVDLLKLEGFEETKISEESYKLAIIITVNTSLFAQDEHLKLIDCIKEAINMTRETQISFISDHKLFKKYMEMNEVSNKYTIDVMQEHEINSDTLLFSNLKYLYNLYQKEINWSWHINKNKSELTVYSDDNIKKNKFAYLFNGYKKEISKNLKPEVLNGVGDELFTFSIASASIESKNILREDKRITYIDLILGAPSSGKSTLAQKKILKEIIQYTQEHKSLPYVGIIDLGSSYDGLLTFLRQAMPNEEYKLIQKYTLDMNENYCINPFDTQLGSRFLLSNEKAYLINFLALLSTSPNEQKPPSGMMSLINNVIDEAYEKYSDSQIPKIYDSQVEPIVDETLKKINFIIDDKTTWWAVVDALFQTNYYHEAKIAQRYAVPLLSDLIHIAQMDKIKLVFNKVTVDTGENLIEYFIRLITESIGRYPVLTRPTQFSIDGKKVVVIDLEKVAKIGGSVAQQQTAMMYMLSHLALLRGFNYFLSVGNKDEVLNYPYSYGYKKYYDNLFNHSSTPTSLYFDEIHRILNSQFYIEQIIVNIREARRYNTKITLLSQDVENVNPIIMSFLTSIYIFSNSLSQSNLQKLSQNLNSNILFLPQQNKHLKNSIYHLRYTPEGRFESFVTNKVSSEFLWAGTTRIESVRFRDKLVQKVGYFKAINLLSEHYPSGFLPPAEQNIDDILQNLLFLDNNSKLN